GGNQQVYLRDRVAAKTEVISVAYDGTASNGTYNLGPSISDDGRFVVFNANSTNLVNPPTTAKEHVFVRDRCISSGAMVPSCTAHTEVVDVSSSNVLSDDHSFVNDGAPGESAISADGRFVAFASDGTNLVPNDNNAGTTPADMFV